MARDPNLGVSRRALPTDPAGNLVLYDAQNRPLRSVDVENVAFVGREPGPGVPLAPYLPRGDKPRQWFPFSGQNLNYVPRRDAPDLTPFQTLRNLADTSDIVRLAIEDVIQQVVALDWDVHPVDEKADATTMRPRIDRVKKFLDRPDREHSFKRWLTMLLEDCLVIDALTFYRQRSNSGEPFALVPVDGSTIKPIVDYYGRAPEPPETAYQQIGVGRVETEFHRPYLSKEEGEAALARWMDALSQFGSDSPEERKLRVAELVYAPKKPRAFTPYGQSPVERVIITVNLALRRQLHYLAFYTDGNIPEAFWKCPEKWEPSHIETMQDTFEKMLSGESGLRRRLRFMPGGEGAGLENPRGDDEWKKEFDEYLARIVCYAFNTSPLPLVQLMNRATGETSDQQETQSGAHPLMDFVAELLTREVQEFLGEPQLEFIWTEDKERDERLFMEKSDKFVGRGIYTRNEVRDVEGREGIPGGDVATVDTAAGPVPLADFVGSLEDSGSGGNGTGRNPLDVALPRAAGGGPVMGGEASTPAARPGTAASALDVPLPPAAQAKVRIRMVADDLRRWRTVALKSLATGKRRRGFSSTFIPSPLKLALVEWLDHATTREDVEWAFRSVVKARRPVVAVRRRIRLERRMRSAAQAHFKAVAPDVASLVVRHYQEPDPESAKGHRIAFKVEGPTDDAVDATFKWKEFVESIRPILFDAYLEGETLAADVSGADVSFGLTDEQATAYAKERAAELVGKRILADGSVVENPNARWSIPASARDRLKKTIATAFEEGWSEKKLQEEIESPRFWSWRSDMIARTEVATALNRGTVQAYREGGVETVIIHDGAGCLEDGHDDSVDGVDGEEWPVEKFEEYPIGHPNCRRDAVPNLPED